MTARWMPVQTKLGFVGLIMVIALVILAVFGPNLVPYDPSEQVARPLAKPSAAHWLGTNDLGQDIFSEVIYGARISLTVGFLGALLATVIGVAVGLIAGAYGGWVEALLMRIVDLMLSLPFLPLAIVLGVFVGPGLPTMIALIGGVTWARTARELRSQALSLRERGYIRAAQSMGASAPYVAFRHLLPGIIPLVIPQFVRTFNAAIQLEASLSFLGPGDPTAKSWGSILFHANARSAFLTDTWIRWIIPPGLGITLTVLAFAFLGYDLEQRARPQLRNLGVGTSKSRAAKSAPPTTGLDKALSVQDLTVTYGNAAVRPAVKSVSFDIKKGEIVGVVGESGSGKTTLALACLGLLRPWVTVEGRVLVAGVDLNQLSSNEAAGERGNRVALVPQSAMNALNPIFTVEDQIVEAIQLHRKVSKADARARAYEVLGLVGISADRGKSYPHEFSGGMRQRVLIAMALVNNPDLVIADEPTTGLDVLVQFEILDLLRDLRDKLGISILFISHDLPVVFNISDRVLFMHNGEVVDQTIDLTGFGDITHSYARTLVESARSRSLDPEGVR